MEKLLLRCYVVLIAFTLLFMVGCSGHETPSQGIETTEQSAVIPYDPLPSNTKSPIEEGLWQVVSVVDGDTLIIGDSADSAKQYRVRLIGSDTPEIRRPNTPIEPFGQEASDFTKRKIADAGDRVRLSFDGDRVDRYGRTLAMVWLQLPDGNEVWLNELLIREGLAHARLDYRYSHEAKLFFAIAEVDARRNKRNLWGNGEF